MTMETSRRTSYIKSKYDQRKSSERRSLVKCSLLGLGVGFDDLDDVVDCNSVMSTPSVSEQSSSESCQEPSSESCQEQQEDSLERTEDKVDAGSESSESSNRFLKNEDSGASDDISTKTCKMRKKKKSSKKDLSESPKKTFKSSKKKSKALESPKTPKKTKRKSSKKSKKQAKTLDDSEHTFPTVASGTSEIRTFLPPASRE